MNFAIFETYLFWIFAPDIYELLEKEGYDKEQKKMLKVVGYTYVVLHLLFGFTGIIVLTAFLHNSYCLGHSNPSLLLFSRTTNVQFGPMYNPWGSKLFMSFLQDQVSLLEPNGQGDIINRKSTSISFSTATNSCHIGVQSEDSVYQHYLLILEDQQKMGYLFCHNNNSGDDQYTFRSHQKRAIFTDIIKLIPSNECGRLIKMVSSKDGSKVLAVLQTSLPRLSAIAFFSSDYGSTYEGIVLNQYKLSAVTDIASDENLSLLYVASANQIYRCDFAGNLSKLLECSIIPEAPVAHWTSIICNEDCSRVVAIANRVDSYSDRLYFPERAGIYVSTKEKTFTRTYVGDFFGPIAANKELSVLLTSQTASPKIPYQLLFSTDWGFSWRRVLNNSSELIGDHHDYIMRAGNYFVTYSSYDKDQKLKDIQFEDIESNANSLSKGNFVTLAVPNPTLLTGYCIATGREEMWYLLLSLLLILIVLYVYVIQRPFLLKVLYSFKVVGGWKERKTDVFISYARSDDPEHQKRIKRIVKRLRAHHFDVWFDEDDMFGDIQQCMASAIDQTKVVVTCVSPEYVDKINNTNLSNGCLFEFNLTEPNRMIPIRMSSTVGAPPDWRGRLRGKAGNLLALDFSCNFETEKLLFATRMSELKRLIDRTIGEQG